MKNQPMKKKTCRNGAAACPVSPYYSLVRLVTMIVLAGTVCQSSGQVKVYQKQLTLPSYGVADPEIMPDWGAYRYPYPLYDRLTNEKKPVTYNALYVENEYVRALVLPEIGGRLHGAADKTNGYEFLYDQKVIKPGLVSTTGAWISGGVEWNFPIGHRPSCFRDTDWTLTENADGSKTAWTGEFDRISGMRWMVGTTVHPGRNWVETRVRLFNSTPYVQRFQYWATSAVRATANYQAVIPGEVMTGHGKREFYHWPVHEGVDLSYWKNIAPAGSYFAVDSESDFFGGYSPEEQAGMVHVADHHIVRGKKLWTWGTAPAGRLWEKILTDGDLPYFEPQAGAYSDNQPSLFWIMPGETKIFSHYWYPVRDIGVFDYANLEGALSLELRDGKAVFGWSPTGVNRDATVILRDGTAEIYRKKVYADPSKPFLAETSVPSGVDLYQLKLAVLSAAGDTLLACVRKRPSGKSLPEPGPLSAAPEEVASTDELYSIADRLNRFNDTGTANACYQEILKRDPGDVRTNTALGEIELKSGRADRALEYFDTSLRRDEDFFRAWYGKGLAQLNKGDLIGAGKSLNRSSYDQRWYAAAHFELAQLAVKLGQREKALGHIVRSIAANGDNTDAHALHALILSKLGRYGEALSVIAVQQAIDPLSFWLQAVKGIILAASGAPASELKAAGEELAELLRSDSENHIETAIRFARCGSYADAAEVLDRLSPGDNIPVDPQVCYFRAYYRHLAGQPEKATADLTLAGAMSIVYSFPNRLECFPVLEWSLGMNSSDANAHHLLAMLLYSRNRTAEAQAHWEKAVATGSGNAVALRSLAVIYEKQGDLHRARNFFQLALKANPSAGKVLIELGLLNKKMELGTAEQIALFEQYPHLVSSYNQAAAQLVELYVIAGRFADAMEWLKRTHFNSWEGRYGIHQLWEQANIRLGDSEMENRRFESALQYYRQALDYPLNLEVAEQPRTIHLRKYFKLAQALDALGRTAEASDYLDRIIACELADGNAFQYFRGRALEARGKKKEAKQVFEKMLAALDRDALPEQQSAEDPMIGGREKDHAEAKKAFVRSLALEGLKQTSESSELRNEAIAGYPFAELSVFGPPRAGY